MSPADQDSASGPADWWRRPRRVAVIVDTPGWFDRFAESLVEAIRRRGDHAVFVRRHKDVPEGDVAFYLSCTRITPPDVLARHRLNLVVHASDLPRGRGFSPLVWQILEGRNRIPLTMIEARDPVDSGDIYMRSELRFEGHELEPELRGRMGEEIIAMCMRLLESAEPPGAPERQAGEPTWWRRRSPADSRLDPDATIAEQFELLRVVDNDRYPAFFDFRGHRYVLRIEDAGPSPAGDPAPDAEA